MSKIKKLRFRPLNENEAIHSFVFKYKVHYFEVMIFMTHEELHLLHENFNTEDGGYEVVFEGEGIEVNDLQQFVKENNIRYIRLYVGIEKENGWVAHSYEYVDHRNFIGDVKNEETFNN